MISNAWAQRILNGMACAEGEHLHWGRRVFASLGTGCLLSATPCPYSEAMTMVSALCRIWPEPASSIPFLSVLLPLTSFQPHGLLPISRVHQVWSHLGAFASTIPLTLRVLSSAIHVDLCGSFPPLLLIYSEATSSRWPALISHANIVPLPPLQPLLAPASCSLSFPPVLCSWCPSLPEITDCVFCLDNLSSVSSPRL